jgi:hypothetical protein
LKESVLSNPVVLVLATQRLTQLVVEDEITAPLRGVVSRWAQGWEEGSFRERIDFALNCGACTSVYAGAAVLLADKHPIGRALVRVLAASAASLAFKAAVDKLEG